ncbi:MAG TPA: J domain-containing protein [Rhodothermales bacterium]|nr:J domain-containing protein [Rhodothermales bacterium]
MPAPKDHYATLGVAEDASADDIKKAFRRLAREYHPDRNSGDRAAEDKFKEVQEAYDTVGDAAKRKQYDRMRRDPFAGGFGAGAGAGPGRYYRAPDGTYVHVDAAGAGPEQDYTFSGGGIEDILGGLFGGGDPFGRRAQRQPATRDTEAVLPLPFEDALRGGGQTFRVGDETLRLEIPQGVKSGHKMRLRGRGPEGPGGRGDLYVTIEVQPHPRFRRDGDDLILTETVNAVEAMLGAPREVETPYGGRVRVKVRPGTQPGERLRLRGQGVRSERGTGDLYVEVAVTIPRELSDEGRAALEEWGKANGLVAEE